MSSSAWGRRYDDGGSAMKCFKGRRRQQVSLTPSVPSFILDGVAVPPGGAPLMVNSISADILSRRAAKAAAGANVTQTAFLVFDTESIPDGRLIGRVKYPRENL